MAANSKTTKRRPKGPSLEILKTLRDELDGIDSILPSISDSVPNEEDDSEMEITTTSIEAEEVEVAASALVSTINGKLGDESDAESFGELFADIFGDSSKEAELAAEFEEAIEGYFGDLFGEDLDRASELLYDLIALVKARIDKWNQ